MMSESSGRPSASESMSDSFNSMEDEELFRSVESNLSSSTSRLSSSSGTQGHVPGGATIEEIHDGEDDTAAKEGGGEEQLITRDQLLANDEFDTDVDDDLDLAEDEDDDDDDDVISQSFGQWFLRGVAEQFSRLEWIPRYAYKYTSLGVTYTGKCVWVLGTSATMLGVPLVFAIETERLRVLTDDAVTRYQQMIQQPPSQFDSQQNSPYTVSNTSGIPTS